MTRSPQAELQAFIDRSPVSRLQRTVFALCFLVLMIDGFDTTVIGFVAPAIAREWSIAPSAFGAIFALGVAGAVVGALIFGPIADRVGRKSTLIAAAVLFGLVSIGSGWAQTLPQLAMLRFVCGIGLGGALPSAIALSAEYAPSIRKSSLVTLIFCGFSIGSAVGGLVTGVAVPVYGWRAILIAGGVMPLILAPVLWRLLPESIGFLLGRGTAIAEVGRIVDRISPGSVLDLAGAASFQPHRAASVAELFRVRPAIGNILLWGVSFLTLLVVGLTSSWMPTLLSTRGYSLREASFVTLMFQVGAVVGAFGLGRLMDRHPPNRVLGIGFLLAAVSVATIGLVSSSALLAATAVFLTGLFLTGGQYGMWAYVASYYPTHVRATGVSWNSANGRAGSIVGSFMGGPLLAAGLGITEILLLMAVPAAIGGGLLFLHPRRPEGD